MRWELKFLREKAKENRENTKKGLERVIGELKDDNFEYNSTVGISQYQLGFNELEYGAKGKSWGKI